MTIAAKPPSSKQYLVYLPADNEAAVVMKHPQTEVELNLSTDSRRVLTLTKEQKADLFARVPGCEIFKNEKVWVPSKEELKANNRQAEELFDTSPLAAKVAAALPESIFVHGADKLHAQGVKGNSSDFAPINVILDTGIAEHTDFGDRGIVQYDAFQKKETPFHDGHGHGTHCEGITGADGVVRGMAPASRFIAIKGLDDRGGGTFASLIAGIEQTGVEYDKRCAGQNRTMVVNVSLGASAGPLASDPLHKALKAVLANRPGLHFSFAAGNNGRPDSIATPGTFATYSHPQVIVVAAIDTRDTVTLEDDARAKFSSQGGNDVGKGQDALRKAGVAADGVNVLSTVTNNGHAKFSGTSMATPHVTGAALLLLDLAGKLFSEGKLKVLPQDVKPFDLIRETAIDNPAWTPDQEGFGTLAVDRAAQLLIERYGQNGACL